MGTMEIVSIIISLFGGLALFLYGMSMLGQGLEKVSSGRMEKILESLTNNIFKSVLLGAFVTAAVQSSSATTVIVVGLVNAGILKLSSAVGVIMGANIGTTVTGQLLRLGDLENNENVGIFLKFLKPTTLAPMIAIVGILIFMISNRDKFKNIGEILLGFGILFHGMFAMEAAVRPLSELDAFARVFETLSNPILGVVAGALVTALIQSSSASVGILQAISTSGALTFSSAFPIIMGQNIGTCITPILSSIGANKNAKRAAMIHLYFNIIGTVLFLVGVYSIQSIWGFPFWDSAIDRGGIANFHTLFNIVVTAVLIPFSKVLEKLAVLTIRNNDKAVSDGPESEMDAEMLDQRFLKSPSLAIQQALKAVVQMGKFAQYNFRESCTLFEKYDQKTIDRIREYEEAIDRMEDKLNAYLINLTDLDLTEPESRDVTALLHLLSEFERIGDYSINIVESAEELYDKQLHFSDEAMEEFRKITGAVDEIIQLSITATAHNDLKTVTLIEPLEETIDQINDTLKSRHVQRFKTGQCAIECGVIFLDFLTNLERISDHCSNIGVYIIGRSYSKDGINRHEYVQTLHKGESPEYREASEHYAKKYAL